MKYKTNQAFGALLLIYILLLSCSCNGQKTNFSELVNSNLKFAEKQLYVMLDAIGDSELTCSSGSMQYIAKACTDL